MKINSVDKAITVLNCFTAQMPVLGVGDISAETGYTLSTVSRLLSTMEKRGVVERVDASRKYQLGYRVYLWGVYSRNQYSLIKFAKPVMKKLNDACGEEVSLYVISDKHRICIDRVPSKHAIAMSGSIGAKLPLYTGASGQVLLAFLSPEKRKMFFDEQSLERFTDHTITVPDALEVKLQKICKQGYAVSIEEREPGAYSIVAPVSDTKNHVVASLSISGPVYRLSDDIKALNIKRVLLAAENISNKIASRLR